MSKVALLAGARSGVEFASGQGLFSGAMAPNI
jgi:hypothetical protein